MKDLLRIFVLVTFIFSTQTGTVIAQTGWAKSYENGVVVTAEKHASKIGRDIMEQGGNAVDAAVAVQFALAVTLPRAGNIGGGGFMVIHLSNGTNTALDFREKAPMKASEDMYIRDGEYVSQLSREGALAVGVPGVVEGMITAIERYGRLPLEAVLNPAIELAKNGYKLSWIQARDLNNYTEVFEQYDAAEEYFIKDDGSTWKEGDLFVQEDLAKTLERIARFGRDGFYSGETADLIVREMRQQGGLISYNDLQNYESVWRDPVRATFRGYELYIMPPPSSGSIAIHQMLDMLKPYSLREQGFNSAKYVHIVTETMRRAFADRAYFLGDPDYAEIPQQELMSADYNKQRMESFDWNRASTSNEIGHGEVPTFEESTETTHFSVFDEDGNAVSVTTTLNSFFGSKVAVSGAGFILNNEMDDFTAEPGELNKFGLIQGEVNSIESEKRMLSSMTPTIVTKNGKVRMILGAAGGPRIITATLQNFLNFTVFEMKPNQAVSAPRFHHQWIPDKLYYEEFGLSPDTQKKLKEIGHNLTLMNEIGRAHIIYIDENGLRFGAPDPRFEGTTEGY